ncbi:hypothetical protein [Streptomyces longwoodensis]|uniref:hypothetical protein n=1 Tax=Streptomyces longwoodensis TaxID=68231 RepID=UPI003F546B16
MVKQIEKTGLQLTQRGFGPWARVYREPEGSKRRCGQLCILPWNALDAREWDKKDDPQLRSHAEKDPATGEFKRAFNDDALTQVYPVVECKVPDEHPALKGKCAWHHMRTPAEMLMQEPYDWCRPLTDEECANPYLVAIDINVSFAAAANGLTVGLYRPTRSSWEGASALPRGSTS